MLVMLQPLTLHQQQKQHQRQKPPSGLATCLLVLVLAVLVVDGVIARAPAVARVVVTWVWRSAASAAEEATGVSHLRPDRVAADTSRHTCVETGPHHGTLARTARIRDRRPRQPVRRAMASTDLARSGGTSSLYRAVECAAAADCFSFPFNALTR